jgi:hypothetical protein
MIKPWFLTEGKLTTVLIKPFSWGSQLDSDLHYHTPPQQRYFWRRSREKRRLLQGEFRMHILYFVLSFAFTLFLLALFYQKHKKNSFLYCCYFFTLVHYVVP